MPGGKLGYKQFQPLEIKSCVYLVGGIYPKANSLLEIYTYFMRPHQTKRYIIFIYICSREDRNTTLSEMKLLNRVFTEYEGVFVRCLDLSMRSLSEDIVVESIVYYWERRRQMAANLNIPAYILEVVKHKCLNYLRHQHIRQGVE